MKINILVSNKTLGDALGRFFEYVFGLKNYYILLSKDFEFLNSDILSADFWIIEAFKHEHFFDPEGFRTAYALAGKIRCFLLFLYTPENFSETGSFWCKFLDENFKEKIAKAMKNPPPEKKDFDKLIKLWPDLLYKPKLSHH